MNITLWVLQVLLAMVFLAHGWLFLFPPVELLVLMNASIPPAFRIFIGVAEVLAAVGLTVPGITRILPWLIPCAAAGVMIVMIAATILHIQRGELTSAIATAVLLLYGHVCRLYALEGDADPAANRCRRSESSCWCQVIGSAQMRTARSLRRSTSHPHALHEDRGQQERTRRGLALDVTWTYGSGPHRHVPAAAHVRRLDYAERLSPDGRRSSPGTYAALN